MTSNFFIFHLTGNVAVPDSCIHVESKSKTSLSFAYQCADKFRRHVVGINSHVSRSIEKGYLDADKLWFSNYLKSHPTEDDVDVAEVTVFFRVIQREETLCQDFVDDNIHTNQLDLGGRATHFVEKVFYGAEFICSLQRDVNLRRETKESVEDSIYLAAATYFNEAINTDWNRMQIPTQLENVSCKIFSSVNVGQITETSFEDSCNLLRNAIKDDSIWRPVDIAIQRIPEQLEMRMQIDKFNEENFELERYRQCILKMARFLLNNSSLERVPRLKIALRQFGDLLDLLWDHIEKSSSRYTLKAIDEAVLREQNQWKELLSRMMSWLNIRSSEIKKVFSLMDNTKLHMLDLTDIEGRPLSSCEKRARVFIIQLDYEEDSLIEEIQKTIGVSTPDSKWPIFPILSAGEERLEAVSNAFNAFTEEARWCENPINSYHIGLVPMSSPRADGTIKTIFYPARELSRSCLMELVRPNFPLRRSTESIVLESITEEPAATTDVVSYPLKRRHDSVDDSGLVMDHSDVASVTSSTSESSRDDIDIVHEDIRGYPLRKKLKHEDPLSPDNERFEDVHEELSPVSHGDAEAFDIHAQLNDDDAIKTTLFPADVSTQFLSDSEV